MLSTMRVLAKNMERTNLLNQLTLSGPGYGKHVKTWGGHIVPPYILGTVTHKAPKFGDNIRTIGINIFAY